MANNKITALALYYHNLCGYCRWVLEEIDDLSIEDEVELRDIRKQPEFAAELRQGGGKQQVPCLKISRVGEDDEWLYESRLIVEFLRNHY